MINLIFLASKVFTKLYLYIMLHIKLIKQHVHIQIYNNIAEDGLAVLESNQLLNNEADPDALLLRSQVLTKEDFNDSLKCIGRAGAGTNKYLPKMQLTKVLLFLIHLGLMQMLLKS